MLNIPNHGPVTSGTPLRPGQDLQHGDYDEHTKTLRELSDMIDCVWDEQTTHTPPLPLLREICPEDVVVTFKWLQDWTSLVDRAVAEQHALAVTSELTDTNRASSLAGPSTATLRVRIFNTHHNQLLGSPNADSYSTDDLTTVPPPRWILRLQGKLLDTSDGSGGRNRTTTSPLLSAKLTSFFERIIVSTVTETIVWDRRQQTPQPSLEHVTKTGLRHAMMQHVSRLCSPATSASSTASSPRHALKNRLDSFHRALLHTSLTDAMSEQLIDFDCLELCRTGDVEEKVTLTFFPYYKVPHYSLSPALEAVVGVPCASMSDICHALWMRCAKNGIIVSAGESTDPPTAVMGGAAMTLPCDPALRDVLGLPETSQTLDFRTLPELLKPHLFPPRPTTVTHLVRVQGDLVDNETVFDFPVPHLCCDTSLPFVSRLDPWLAPDGQCGLPSFLESPPHCDTTEEPSSLSSPQRSLLSDEHMVLQALRDAVTRVRVLRHFAHQPAATTMALLENQAGAVDDACRLELGLMENRASFYQQPWTRAAVDAYVHHRGANFDDLITRSLGANATERGAAAAAASDPKISLMAGGPMTSHADVMGQQQQHLSSSFRQQHFSVPSSMLGGAATGRWPAAAAAPYQRYGVPTVVRIAPDTWQKLQTSSSFDPSAEHEV